MTLRKLIAGNWKMHGSLSVLTEIDTIAAAAKGRDVDVAICPPFTLIARATGRGVAIGAQDCHAAAKGAHTGCVSAAMLVEAGAAYCIVGHSERRADNFETDADVKAKADAVIGAGMTAILCVGETVEQRRAGQAVEVVEAQLAGSLPASRDNLAIAYEPVWAIGTGLVPSNADVAEMHAAIRAVVGPDVRILYGGSVKPSNAAELLHVANVDGALVGGASLTAADFVPIIEAVSVR
ncbi:triose-phosphate isomerase [Sphingomonas sp. SUN039]|uniref:triose-phosphate isomerase n=1 Tax=Sphingomonas sp. SUN039 TaxID=2937787 RepID=UPI002164C780|nr:triose-phosphate isomerase [Sphingomonas sp. SUN039]UVO53198.1 triose-phosphate isomerase [Sphingomonas sp. SUN039]